MNSLYKDSRSRSFHSEWARMVCVRCVIQVVAMEAAAPTKEPSAAAIAATTVEVMVHSLSETSASVLRPVRRASSKSLGPDGTERSVGRGGGVNGGTPAGAHVASGRACR